MIAVEDLSFSYTADEPIVEHLDWQFAKGTLTAVTGPSGCGKSTLMYLLGLLLSPSSGRVLVRGADVRAWSDRQRSGFRASRVGFVFQDAALDPTRTVLDNIIESSIYNHTGRKEAATRAVSLMAQFGVAPRADHKPGELSGGQAQRIALCRALLADPALVLADEPTGNLDVDSADVVLEALHQAAHNDRRTVVIATHDSAIVEKCDLVLAL